MTQLLDTNICVAFLNGTDPSVNERLLAGRPTDYCLCSVVKAELIYGARASARIDSNLTKLDAFFAPFDSPAFDDGAAVHYGALRALLRAQGNPIGANDMMIAAIAMSRDLTLVTRNDTEFRRIAGLRVVTW